MQEWAWVSFRGHGHVQAGKGFLSPFLSGSLSPVGVGGEAAEVPWVRLGPQRVDREGRVPLGAGGRQTAPIPAPRAGSAAFRQAVPSGRWLGQQGLRGAGGEVRAV